MWFLNRSNTNQAVQSQKQARVLKFRIKGVVTPMRISLMQTCENGKTVIFCIFLTKVLKICYITNPVIDPLTNGKRRIALC